MYEIARFVNGMAKARLPLVVIENPNKTWSFAGSVPAALRHFRRDGKPLTAEDCTKIASFGAGLFRKEIGVCVWQSREDAVAAARTMGFEPQ